MILDEFEVIVKPKMKAQAWTFDAKAIKSTSRPRSGLDDYITGIFVNFKIIW